jgi:AraC-like DNA-binding protein
MHESVAHEPAEPAQVLITAMLAAASGLARLPRWFDAYPLQLTSPTARQVLWMIGRRVTNNPDTGFRMAERVPEDALGSLWSVYEVAPSVRVLSRAYNDWSSLLLDFVAVEVVDEGSATWVRLVARDGTELDRGEQDFRAAMLVKLWRRLQQSPSFAPSVVHFTYDRPHDVGAHRLALGTENLRFSQKHLQLCLPCDVADAPLPGADPEAFKRRSTRASEQVRSRRPRRFEHAVEARITEQLKQGPREVSVARALGLSIRSLRRRLSAQGVNFRELVDRARKREGHLYLEASELTVVQVARLLGFTGDGALRNSMRRWSSSTPAAWRKALTATWLRS